MNKDQSTRRSWQWWLNGHSHQGEPHFSATNKNAVTALQWRPRLYDPCHSTLRHRHLKKILQCTLDPYVFGRRLTSPRGPCRFSRAAVNVQLLSHEWQSDVPRRHLTAPSPRLHSKSKTFLLGGVNNLLILWNFNLSKSCGGGHFKMHQHARLGWSLLETQSALARRWCRSTFFRNLQSLINCN